VTVAHITRLKQIESVDIQGRIINRYSVQHQTWKLTKKFLLFTS